MKHSPQYRANKEAELSRKLEALMAESNEGTREAADVEAEDAIG